MTCFCPSFPLPHHARLSDPGADLPEFVDCGEPMGSSDAFIRATINRLGARIGHGLADAAAEIAVLAQDAPDRLRQEWDLFQEEVRAEADRLERGPEATQATDLDSTTAPVGTATEAEPTSQELVDRLRASVAEINTMLEVRS